MEKSSFARAAEAALIALALCVMAVLALSVQRLSEESGLAALSAVGGWYRVENGERVSVALPDVFSGGAPVTLCTDELTAADAGRVFSARGVQYGLEIWLGDKLLYRYEPTAFPRNRQMMGKLWAEVLLPEETGSAPLCLRLTDPDAHMRLSAPVVGSLSAVTGYHLRRLSVSAVLTLFMFTIGVLSLVAFVYMGHKRLPERRFLDAAAFLLLCSLWSWTDSGLLQVYGSHVASWSMVSFFAFMLMGVPMLHFVANTVRPSLRRAARLRLPPDRHAARHARADGALRRRDDGRSSARICRRARQERARLPHGVHRAGQLQHGRAGAVLGVSHLLV